MQIALLGSAPSSRLLAPFGDVNWEIWCCSPMNHDLPRIDAWFEMHSLDRKFVPGNEVYRRALEAHPRVYLSKPDPRLPHGIPLNPKPYIAKYGPYFFTSSMAWMFAHALAQKPTAIGIWGCDMSAHEEYGYQRAGMHYFMQQAEREGVKLYIPLQSDIAEGVPLYGYKEHSPMFWKQRARKQELQERVNNLMNKERSAEQERLMLQGALDDMLYIDHTWLKVPEDWDSEPPVVIDNVAKNELV